MLPYLSYQARHITYRRFLLLWGLVGVIISHSSLAEPESFFYAPGLAQMGNRLFLALAVVGFLLFLVGESLKDQLRIDLYTLLAACYIAFAPLSAFINGVLGTVQGLEMILIPGTIGLILTRVFDARDAHKMIHLMVIFGIVNVALFFVITGIGGIGESGSTSVFFSDRNGFARYMVIISCYLYVQLIDRVRHRGAGDRLSLLTIAGAAIIFISFALQYSRSGYIVYLLAIGVLVFFSQSRLIKKWALFVLPVVTTAFAILTYLRIAAEKLSILNISDVQRISLLKAGANMILAHPWIGVGYHMSMSRFLEFSDKNFPAIKEISSIHNWYVNVWAEQGAFALGVFLCLNIGLMVAHFRVFTKTSFTQGKMSLFCFCALLVLMVDGLFLPNYDYESIYWIVIAVSIIFLRSATVADHLAASARCAGCTPNTAVSA